MIYDSVAHTLDVSIVFQGLSASAAAGHIHCCFAAPTNAIVATPFSGLPAAASGSFQQTLDLTLMATYSPAFLSANGGSVSAAEADLAAGLAARIAYVNLHTSNFPNGEIRGYLVAAPEPGVCALLAAGALGVVARRRR